MVSRSLPTGYQLIPHRPRKRKIGNAVTMEVSNFPFADAEFVAAEAVRPHGHTRPPQKFALNYFTDFIGRGHDLAVWVMDWVGVPTSHHARAN